MRRALLYLALVVAVVGPSICPPPASATLGAPSGWVKWVVDHRARTITISAKLQIYLSSCEAYRVEGNPNNPTRILRGDCSATAADIAKAIKGNIEKVWNGGYRYRCYRIIVKVDVTVTTNRFTVDADRVGMRVDRSIVPIRAHVHATFGSAVTTIGNWQSNDPSDRIEPDNTALLPTEVGYPSMNPNTYAHEFGHMLGLHDTYTWWSGDIVEGAADDLMSTGINFIDQTTIDRVVERNRDRLVDTKGHKVNLDDLICDRQFVAWLTGGEPDYQASHLQNSLALRPCIRTPVSQSVSQTLTLDSLGIPVNLIEATGRPGYTLKAPTEDLRRQGGIGGGWRNVDLGWFDLPVTVGIQRSRSRPASGAVPPVFDLLSRSCADSPNPGPTPRPDCGQRQYDSWMTISVTNRDEAWPVGSIVPPTLRSIGRNDVRLNLLYRNCGGPIPWPGDFKDDPLAVVTPGKLPTIDQMVDVYIDWVVDGKYDPNKALKVSGDADLKDTQTGSLRDFKFNWTLTFCPLNKDDKMPPGCP